MAIVRLPTSALCGLIVISKIKLKQELPLEWEVKSGDKIVEVMSPSAEL